jgi:AbiTii
LLLDEIVSLATDNKQPLSVLLRKCLILAHELKNERLKNWVSQELNGYTSVKDLPEYRTMGAQARGNFMGPGGALITNRNLPAAVMEKNHRWAAEFLYLIQPVSAYESMAQRPGQIITFPWDNDMVLYYQERFLQYYALVSAWQEVPLTSIIGILDTIRTRVLNMALEIRSEIGKTDADLERLTPEKAERVEQTITNNIYGGNVYVATGGSTINATNVQQQTTIIAGNWDHLKKALHDAGIGNAELDELSKAVQSDGDHKLREGGSVMKWVKANAPKVLAGGVKMGTEIGKPILTEFLMRYYGLKS